MKLLSKLVNWAAAISALGLFLGLAVGLMPMAIVFPEHGKLLVKVQAGGLCLVAGSLLCLAILGLLAGKLDSLHLKKP